MNYTKTHKLGEGTYGAVFRAIDKSNNEVVVLKVIKMDQEEDGVPANSLREVSILKNLNHANIVSLRKAFCENGMLIMAMEFMDRDLRTYLSCRKLNSPALLQSYAFQLICAVNYLHNNGYVHCDIKPSNILINAAGLLKLSDFGRAHQYSYPLKKEPSHFQTSWYLAPELLLDTQYYGMEVDMWAAGCVIAEMARGSVMFAGDSPVDQLILICKALGTPTPDEWPEFNQLLGTLMVLPPQPKPPFEELFPGVDPNLIDLISNILVMNPSKRFTAREALRHPYFKGIIPELVEICMRIE